MPLHRRLPKRGFTNIFKKEYSIVNISRLAELEGDAFDAEMLVSAGVLNKVGKDGLKILGDGDLTRKITVKAHLFSATARKKIEGAGGSVEVLTMPAGGPKPRKDGKGQKKSK